jgi:uncharacterized membrane protein
LVLLALCLCLAVALRTVQLTESLWLDELHTAWVVADGPDEVCPRAAIGNQSPVYFLLVWAMTQAGGLTEVSLRLPSVIAGAGLVVLAFYVARQWTGQNAAGVFAALLVALDRNCIFYAQEARPYAWVQLFGLAHVYLFQRQVYQPAAARRLVLLVIGVLLFYLHYTSVLLLAAETAYYALLHTRGRWRPAYHWRRYLLDMAVVGLCLLPASWHLIEIAARRGNWAMFISQRPFLAVWSIFPLSTYVGIPLAVVVAAFASRSFASRWSRRRRQTDPSANSLTPSSSVDLRYFVLTACWLLVPLLLAWSLTAWDIARLFFVRYVIACVVAPMLFAAICFAACPSRIWRAVCVIGVVYSVVYQGGIVWQIARDGRVIGDRNQDWRTAVRSLHESSIAATTPVFVRSGLIEAEGLRSSPDSQLREYCLLPVRTIYRLRHNDESLIPLPTTRSGRLSPTNRQRVLDAGTAWFLLLGGPRTTASVERELLTGWQGCGVRPTITERRRFGLVAILRLEVRAAIND